MKKDEKSNKLSRVLEGNISISSKGTGYVSVAGQDEDIEIGHAYLSHKNNNQGKDWFRWNLGRRKWHILLES